MIIFFNYYLINEVIIPFIQNNYFVDIPSTAILVLGHLPG